MTDKRDRRQSIESNSPETDESTLAGKSTRGEGAIDSSGASAEGRDVRHGNDYTGSPDSGFLGAGSNEGEGNDNLERETTPGYQEDKWKRGTIMPR